MDRVVLPLGPVGRFLRRFDLVEDAREVEAVGLPVRDHLLLFEQLGGADDLVQRANAERGQDFAHLFGDEEEVVDDMLRRALEALAQHRVLRGDAHRTGVEVALAHHDAAGRNQRRGGETELVGPEQRADDDVATGLQAAVDLQCDARAQLVEHERLVRFGKADFPGRAGMLQRGERRSARAAIEAGDGDMVRARLGNTGGDRADADFRDELDRDIRLGLTFFRS
jgi:hypothetical protein